VLPDEILLMIGDREILTEAQRAASLPSTSHRRVRVLDTLTYWFGDDSVNLEAADAELQTVIDRSSGWLRDYTLTRIPSAFLKGDT
jgi:hypothetical protein